MLAAEKILLGKADMSRPAAIADLAATRVGEEVQLAFTTPADAALFMVVYDDRPIVEDYNKDGENFRN